MRIADDTEAIGRRYRELFRPNSEQQPPPKPEPERKSVVETMCRCGRPVSDCFFCCGKSEASSPFLKMDKGLSCVRRLPRSR